MKPFAYAAVRVQLSRLLLRDSSEFCSDKMFRIPTLSRPLVRNPGQRAAAWWPPIGRKDRLSNNQHARLPVRAPRNDLLGGVRPPQTSYSSRGHQEHDPESIGIAVKSSGK